jgi:phosphoserine aminotransferase
MTVYNFCAGPAMLPVDVMQTAQQDLLNWQSTGCSVMEMSHRSPEFIEVYESAVESLTRLMNIPSSHSVLFMQGGGRGQFAAVPLNLTLGNVADYFTSGSWSNAAVEEAAKFCDVNAQSVSSITNGYFQTTPITEWKISNDADFIHFCPNETVDGIEIFESPAELKNRNNVPVVADMSSTILSRTINVDDYDVIYAGAQKNIGPSGLAIVIIRNALLDRSSSSVPSILNYQITAEKQSMFNTPPTFAIYLANLVFKWLLNQGGVAAIENKNSEKSELLYQTIDKHDFYINNVSSKNRSRMNVVFQLADPALDKTFLEEASKQGLVALKGHRSVGGMRASLYNAMPIEGVKALVAFMNDFAAKHSN